MDDLRWPDAGEADSSNSVSAGKPPQRVHMAAPTAKAGLTKGRMVRNSNKHKRLFDPDEPNGVKVNPPLPCKIAQSFCPPPAFCLGTSYQLLGKTAKIC